MKKLLGMASKTLGFLYIFFLYHLRKNAKVNNNRILIILSGHIGNALMDMHAVFDLKNYYIAQGKQVYILTSANLWKLMNRCFDFSDTVFASDKFLYEKKEALYFRNLRALLRSLDEHSYEAIVPNLNGGYLIGYLEAALRANEKWGVTEEGARTDLRVYFNRACNRRVIVDENLHESQRLKRLLTEIGVEDHIVKITHIPSDGNKAYEGEYITLALDSMSTERRWPVENFIRFSEYIISNTGYDIYLTGSSISAADAKKLESLKKNGRVKDYIGKTTLDEWIEMLRGSSFHLSVDSGSVHVAASVGTPCVCLSGVWDGTRCMPYQLEGESAGTRDPVCVYQEDYLEKTEKCYGCRMRHGWYGIGNSECRADVVQKKPCHCLSGIGVSDAIKAFNEITR